MPKKGNIYHQYTPNVSINLPHMDPSWVMSSPDLSLRGPRFGGALDDAARMFCEAFDLELTPERFVESLGLQWENSGRFMGKPWENGFPWENSENHGKTMGQAFRKVLMHRNFTMVFLGDFHGKRSGKLAVSQESHGQIIRTKWGKIMCQWRFTGQMNPLYPIKWCLHVSTK